MWLQFLRSSGKERSDLRSSHAPPPAGLGWVLPSDCSGLGIAVWNENRNQEAGRWILYSGIPSDVELAVRRCIALRGEETKLEIMSSTEVNEIWLASKRKQGRTCFIRLTLSVADRGIFWQQHWDTVSAYLDWLCTKPDLESIRFELNEELRSPIGICPQVNSTAVLELLQWARDEFSPDFLAKVLLQVGRAAPDILAWRNAATPVRTFVIGEDPLACEAFLALLYALILPRGSEYQSPETHSKPIVIKKRVSAGKSGFSVPAASSLGCTPKTAIPELSIGNSSSQLLRRAVQSYGTSPETTGGSSVSSNSTTTSNCTSVLNDRPVRFTPEESCSISPQENPPIAGYHRKPLVGFAAQAGQFSDNDIEILLEEDLRIMGYTVAALVVNIDEHTQAWRRPGEDKVDIVDIDGVDGVQVCLENLVAPIDIQREVGLCTNSLD